MAQFYRYPARMGIDVRCVTDGGFEVLYDPSTLSAPLPDDWWEHHERQVAAGTMALREFGDGVPVFRVFVGDEAPPRSFLARVAYTTSGRLHLPSGRLHIVAMEHVGKSTEVREVRLEPGWYDVTLDELDFDGVVEWLSDRAAKKASPLGARVNDLFGMTAGCLLLLLGIAAIATVILVAQNGLAGWSTMWPWLLGDATLLGLIAFAWRQVPDTEAAAQAVQDVVERFPTALVRLRRAETQTPGAACVLSERSARPVAATR